MTVTDMLPASSDGTGHEHGCECPCGPDTLTDGHGGFYVYHCRITERWLS